MKYIRSFFIASLTLLTTFLFSDENKIVYLISTPRSLSTGFLRMMETRGDFTIFHEPTNAPHDAKYEKEFYDLFFRDDCFQSFEEITESILAQAETSNVFVKEVSFTLPDFLTPDNPLTKRSHFVFLVRKPQDVILSFYRKGCPASRLSDFIGYQQIYELFELIEANAKFPPHLIFSEDLGERPAEIILSFCRHVDIPHLPESLSWKDLGNEFTGENWRDGKISPALHHWHGDAIHSTCFSPLRTTEIDANGIPTFSEIESPEDRSACLDAYTNSLHYYLALKERWKSKEQL